MATTTEKISVLPSASTCADLAFFVGIKNNGDGTYTTQKFSLAQLKAEIATTDKKLITVAAGPDSHDLVDSFFATTISEISTQGQCYLNGVDFTQNIGATKITGSVISFTAGQKILAKI
jgi:hypothetical protein